MHVKNIIETKILISFFLFVGLLVLSFIFLSCKNEIEVSPLSDAMIVNSVQAKKEILDDTVNNFGSITYKTKTDLTAQTGGKITGFNVHEGSYVKKGEVIAVIENVQLEIRKIECEISLESAISQLEAEKIKLNYERLAVESRLLGLEKAELSIQQKELELKTNQNNLNDSMTLHKMGGITDSELENLKLSVASQKTDIALLKKEKEISLLGLRDIDLIQNGIVPSLDSDEKKAQFIELNLKSSMAQIKAMEAQVKNVRQELEGINKMIDELTVRSPISGYIAAKYYENSEYINDNEKLATIIDTDSVYAVFYVQEKDMVNFNLGTKLVLNIPSLNKTVNARIDEISAVADSASGNFSVKSVITNKNGQIKPGMFVRCSIQKGEKSSFVRLP
ncbi:MAG: efflux RND transporter periplasmic adaptor subunit, partial [Treponemataceae bacterium]|nr:efflux RND transporter periplasmic adaptor subunit [Treponemataceae bacterium]